MVDLHMAGGADLLAMLGPSMALIGGPAYVCLVVNGSRPWPARRTLFWLTGSATAAVAVSGPLARVADTSFVAHMTTHLLLGMLAPLLLVLAAPITLMLRTVPVATGRTLSRFLTCRPVTILTEPAVAAALSVGSLWALYTTDLYPAMHHHPVAHLLVHLHLLISGYLFTTAMISVDPLPHRRSYQHRSIVLILALASHDILAKYLFAHPPAGVSPPAAEAGSVLMYYGGDAVEITIMIILGWRWYQSGRIRRPLGAVSGAALSPLAGDV